MSGRDAFDDFTGKWRARWPEWSVAEVFVPSSQRDAAVAWFALLQEFADAAWGGSDPAPGLAKLAWWQEELRGWAKGAHRHPLGSVLQPHPAPWNALADAMPALRHRELPVDAGAARAALQAFSQACAEVEAGLFDAPSSPHGAVTGVLAEPAVAASGPAAADTLLAGWPTTPASVPVPVRLRDALVRKRLVAAAAGGPWQAASRWTTLWRSWRAARD